MQCEIGICHRDIVLTELINIGFADGVDYHIATRSFTIIPDEKSASINVVVFNDTLVEEAEFFDLSIPIASVEGAMLDSMRFFTQVQIRDSNGRLSQYYTMHVYNLLHFSVPCCHILKNYH